MVQLRYKAPRVSIVSRHVFRSAPRDVLNVASTAETPKAEQPEKPEPIIPSRVTLKLIVEVVCSLSGFTPVEIVSPRRNARLCAVRQCVMYLARKHTPMSLPQIGKLLGNRDHSTVHHAVYKIGRDHHKFMEFLENCERLLPVDSRENQKQNAQDTDKSDRLAA